jgi:hypothetical protein
MYQRYRPTPLLCDPTYFHLVAATAPVTNLGRVERSLGTLDRPSVVSIAIPTELLEK